jgi:import inner membrane translocase subunit TIM44
MENIRKGMERDKAMKESLQKLQEETAKVEQSDSFQAVRSGFQTAKSQASAVAARGTLAMKDKYEALSTSVAEMYDRLSQTSVVKDAKKVTEDVAKDVAETMSQQGEQIGKTEAFQKIKAGLQDVKEELFDQAAARSQPYQPPSELKTRSGMSAANMQKDEKRIQADDDTTGVVLHKDSKWYAQWKAFKDDNPVVNRLFDLKMKYDESDNIMIRTSRFVTDRIIQAIGGVFSPSETAQTFAEIAKIDSSFDKENFIKICESLIIPTVLEVLYVYSSVHPPI